MKQIWGTNYLLFSFLDSMTKKSVENGNDGMVIDGLYWFQITRSKNASL